MFTTAVYKMQLGWRAGWRGCFLYTLLNIYFFFFISKTLFTFTETKQQANDKRKRIKSKNDDSRIT